jgi:hypothetical protein
MSISQNEKGVTASQQQGADAVCPGELRSARSHEVIYEAVFGVKSFYGHTLTATPQRLV